MTSPTVSVVVPVCNGALFLEDALRSVYAQTVLPDEVFVVNDGSTDDTEAVLRRLEAGLPSSFSWITQANTGGPAAPRNFAISKTNGHYVALLDHDDVWYPTKLERQLEHFAADSGLALSFTAHRCVGSVEESVIRHAHWDPEPSVVLDKLLRSVAVGPTSTVVVKREALARVPPFDGTARTGDDWKMWLHIAAAGLKIGYLSDVLVDYRWHASNISRDPRKHFDVACEIFDGFFDDPTLSASVRKRGRAWRAHWHLLTAIDAIQRNDVGRARRHILIAARLHPRSIRPGWARMLGVGTPRQ
jgi:glycosyltransferase involved in cell wall biosynthesis